MAVRFYFHPEALAEYEGAADYYLRETSPQIAERFVTAVETAISTLITAPTRWSVVKAPEIRRFVLSRYPFVILYRWEPQSERIAIYAVMHTSREPGYWQNRTG